MEQLVRNIKTSCQLYKADSFIRHTAVLLLATSLFSCKPTSHTFMVADPGHFHAALVLKSNYTGVQSDVFVYAPEGPEVNDFLGRVDGYLNSRENPVSWNLHLYKGPDFFSRLLKEKPGDILVLAGNNRLKSSYIEQAINQGIHVLSDKPMAINAGDFNRLESSFRSAGKKGVLLYDIMTERFEITSLLQKELSQIPAVFGTLLPGTPAEPSVIKESVHHLFKYVSGARLVRPPWFLDVEQQGEGIADVTTHLVDLVQWACFPDEPIDYRKDLEISSARHWTTDLTPDQFRELTSRDSLPDYLLARLDTDGLLKIYSNGEIAYRIRGINARVSVTWNYQAPEGGGDTHFSRMCGSVARLEIRQGEAQKFRPELYLLPVANDPAFTGTVKDAIDRLAVRYPGIGLEPMPEGYRILIPDALRIGHEAHFAQVTRNFLEYLKAGKLPDWEMPNMLAKYWLTTTAREMCNR